MALLGALLGITLAERRGISPDQTNRYAVTGYALSMFSPVVGALVVDQMARTDVANATPPSTVTTVGAGTANAGAPGSNGTAGSTGAVPNAIRIEDYVGQQYADVASRLTKQGIDVRSVNLADSTREKGSITSQFVHDENSHTNTAVQPGSILFVGDTLWFSVNIVDQMLPVPNVFGLMQEAAEQHLKHAGFEYKAAKLDAKNLTADQLKAFAGHVLEQEPLADELAPAGSTVEIRFVPTSRTSATADGPKLEAAGR